MDFIQQPRGMIPVFTIIIPIIHSLEDLERCLASLEHLACPYERFHVVLIDCQIVKGIEGFLREYLPKYHFRATMLTLPAEHQTQTSWLIEARLNEARNLAIQRVPGQYYVFTEDDCTFESDWLQKFETAFQENSGAFGGPDLLPENMEWFPKTLDCLLNSMLGTAGMRRGKSHTESYYPRKENMAIPAKILERIGPFPEDKSLGGEMEMAVRIREAGFQVNFLADNPVWHRRVTTIPNFLRLASYLASQKVRILKQQHNFLRSLHFGMFLAILLIFLLGILSFFTAAAQAILASLFGIYLTALIFTGISCIRKTQSLSVGLGVLLLIPLHHTSIIIGIIRGMLT